MAEIATEKGLFVGLVVEEEKPAPRKRTTATKKEEE